MLVEFTIWVYTSLAADDGLGDKVINTKKIHMGLKQIFSLCYADDGFLKY